MSYMHSLPPTSLPHLFSFPFTPIQFNSGLIASRVQTLKNQAREDAMYTHIAQLPRVHLYQPQATTENGETSLFSKHIYTQTATQTLASYTHTHPRHTALATQPSKSLFTIKLKHTQVLLCYQIQIKGGAELQCSWLYL